jgi:DnaJ-class molecular chaperone
MSFNNVNLEEDEVVCSKCGGEGFIQEVDSPYGYAYICNKCGGKGKLDWCEQVVGVQKSFKFEHIILPKLLNISTKLLAEEIDREIIKSITEEY